LPLKSKSDHFIQIDRQPDAEGYSCGERRRIVVPLRLVVEEVVDGGVEMDTTPEMMLKHEAPDGVTLIDIGATRLGLALTTRGECCIEGIVA
jgi:hypothetical protein